jgi:nucleoside-diphosphate-sugar epimerase
MPHAPGAVLNVATCHLSPATFSVFNVATGRKTSLLDLVAALGELCGASSEVKFAPSRPGDIQHSLADISKIRNILGYVSRGGLKEGLRRLADGPDQ